MILPSGFYLSGFTRLDKNEAGAVFVRYSEEEQDNRKPEICETPLLYGGAGTANYAISIPKPKARTPQACAIVTRTSKNRYSATVYDEKRIESFHSESLDGLRKKVAEFFSVDVASIASA